METTSHLDWLSVTFPVGFQQEILEAYVGQFKIAGHGNHGYAVRKETRMGVVLLDDGSRQQGKNATFSGKALEQLRDTLGSDAPILRLALANRGRASRVDLALNVYNSTLTPEHFWKALKAGDVITKTAGFKGIDDEGQGMNTLYIGSRKSDRFMRIYDKALEQHMDGTAWLRLELQCRRLVARSYVERLGKMDNIRPFVNRALDEFASFPTLEEYRQAVSEDDAEIPVQGRQLPQFWKWMQSQVIPAMVSRAIAFPEEEVLLQVTRLFIKQQAERGHNMKPNDPLLDNG